MENKDLIGKKVRGFKFKDHAYSNLHYSQDMDKYIGKVGVIETYKENSDSYLVKFDDDSWEYPAALIEKYLVNEKEDLIGKKVRGFKFEDTKDVYYVTKMGSHIGEIGIIALYKPEHNTYRVDFPNDYWFYPAAEIEKHLVENEKQNKMKITIKKSLLKEIHDIACHTWKEIILGYAARDAFGDTVELTTREVDGMFDAATKEQLPVLNKIFGEREEKIDFDKIKTGSVVMLKHTGQHCTGIDNIDLKVPVDVVFYKTPHVIDGYRDFKKVDGDGLYCTFHQDGKFVLFSADNNVNYIVKVIEY
jgi:hypothetical protein